MSFILEALKKSEQERALGQVPRIDTGLLVEEPPGPRQGPWVLVAVALAAAAVAIALYAALRETQAPPAALQQAAGSRTQGGSQPISGGQARESVASAQEAPPDDAVGAAARHLRYGPSHPGAEPPAPRAAEDPGEPASPRGPERTIPADLIDDVARFKESVRRERQATDDPRPAPTRAPSPVAPSAEALPAEVHAKLPTFLVTAHVYDRKPSKRFVVINALKYAEGERTREGFQVLEILPDGVQLGFGEHRFFQAR